MDGPAYNKARGNQGLTLDTRHPTLDTRPMSAIRRTSTRTFIALALMHWLGDCFGGMWPIFKYLADLDLARAGMIATISVMLGAGLQPFFGVLSDRGAQRPLFLWGVAMSSMGMMLGPVYLLRGRMSEDLWYLAMLGIMLILCVGQGMYHPSGTSAAGNLNHARRSTFVSLFIAGGMVGYSMSQGLFSIVFHAFNGHTERMMIVAGLILFLGWAWMRPAPLRATGDGAPPPRLRDLRPIALPLLILYLFEVLMGGMYHGFLFLMPEFLQVRGCPAWMIQGGGFFAWVGGSAIIMIPAGHLADRRGGYGILAAFAALAVLLYFAVVLASGLHFGVILLLLFLAGGTCGAVNPMGVAMGQHLDTRHTSLISGILMGLAWAAASPAMWIVGALAKNPALGPAGAVTILGAAGVLGFLLALALPAAIRRSRAAR